MAGGSGARIAVGLTFAAYVQIALAGHEAVLLYQLVFLQGGVIALLSASGYARGAWLATSPESVGPALRRYLGFLAVGSVIAFVIASIVVPLPGHTRAAQILVLVAMMVGAAASALNGLLQGIATVSVGGAASFLPTMWTSLSGCGLMALTWRSQSPVFVAGLWGGVQLLAPLTLLATRRELVTLILARPRNGRPDASYFAVTGLVNCGSVVVAYWFRDRWSVRAVGSDTPTTFMIARIAELFYQMLYVGAASLPTHIDRIVSSRLRQAKSRFIFLIGGLSSAAVGLAPIFLWSQWTLGGIVAAEIFVAPARVVAMACFLALLGNRSTIGYQFVLVCTIACGVLVMWFPRLQSSPYGLEGFQAVSTAVAVLATVVVFAKSPTSHLSSEERSVDAAASADD